MEHVSNDHKDYPNQLEKSHKLCDEARHPIVKMMESQWKLIFIASIHYYSMYHLSSYRHAIYLPGYNIDMSLSL